MHAALFAERKPSPALRNTPPTRGNATSKIGGSDASWNFRPSTHFPDSTQPRPAGDPTWSKFPSVGANLLVHDHPLPATSDTFRIKRMSKIINSLCVSLCFSVSLQLTCKLETFSNNMATTTTRWSRHCGAWPPAQNRWKRPFRLSLQIA